MNYELMEGVQVLSEGICEGSITTGVMVALIGIALFILFLHMIFTKDKSKCDIVGMLTVLCVSIFVIFFSGYVIKNAPTQYKVIIDDSVTLNEFNEMYRIIKQEGIIYTINER